MCGIIGVIQTRQAASISRNLKGFFQQGLYADAVRGWDATGIVAVPFDKDKAEEPVTCFKKHIHLPTFFN